MHAYRTDIDEAFGAKHGFPANKYNQHAWIIGMPKIGSDVWIGPFTVIDASGGLEIGDGVDISCGVHIYTHSTEKRCVSGRRHIDVERKAVRIGARTFIGANAVILKGVRIGKECVIGAGTVVTKDVPDNSIVLGVPGRIVGTVEIEGDDVRFVLGKK
ncbi:acyltransferase [Candidatus Woesearchaeota archaeon]|nr:acyltransferase [Candidatus Woesearchaeota archaeon]